MVNMASTLITKHRQLVISAAIASVCVGLGCYVYFQGDTLPFYHDLQLLWWKMNYALPKQVDALEKLHRLQKAAKLIQNEISDLERRIVSRNEASQKLNRTALTISDDIDYLFKNLDALHNLPHAEKRRKKDLAKVLFDYGVKVDELQQQINGSPAN